MAELTESQIVTKINDIDAQIATIYATLGTSGTGGTQYIDYQIGNKRVSGSQRLDGLIKLREFYQTILDRLPKAVIANHDVSIDDNGISGIEFIGDQ